MVTTDAEAAVIPIVGVSVGECATLLVITDEVETTTPGILTMGSGILTMSATEAAVSVAVAERFGIPVVAIAVTD